MNIDNSAYPYLQVVLLFSGFGSVISGLIAELIVLVVFREASFAQIGFQPLIFVGLFGCLPAFITACILAFIRLKQSAKNATEITFLTGFLVSAFYVAFIVLYLGIGSLLEVGVLLGFMLIGGVFGGTSSIVAGYLTLPKLTKSCFDNSARKAQDIDKDSAYSKHR
ncbi:hypothetical protein [Psychrobacter sp. DM8]|uniref:hypothetical protein n=1 Tax=unclassified Psychrobacter TaxID=196806 RepID=UPI003F4F7254